MGVAMGGVYGFGGDSGFTGVVWVWWWIFNQKIKGKNKTNTRLEN